MANVITVTVRAKDETSGLSAVESKFKASGEASGKGFSDEFGKSTGRGMLGSLFGKSSGSATSDAQRTGQNVGLGLGRGIMQKFSQTLGSGLLSGLFGTSGGTKLFGSAGNTVVQDAARQGENIAQGLGKGLNDGLSSTQNKISGMLSALFGGSGAGPDTNAGEQAGKDAGDGFFRGFTATLMSHKGSLGGALGGLLGGKGGSGSGKNAIGEVAADAAGGGGGGGGGGAGGGLGGISEALSNPYVLTGGIAAALGALPFVAQAAAGGIVAALGGGLAAIAIIGAAKNKTVQKSFDDLKTNASSDLTKIGEAFVPVLNSILGNASSVMKKMEPIFAGAAKTISGPFKQFGDALLKAFGSPAVQNSINAVAKAFGAILTALSPSLSRDIGVVAEGITNIANAVAKNPDAFRNFISFLFQIVGYTLNAIAWLSNMATYIETHFRPAISDIAKFSSDMLRDTRTIWNDLYGATVGVAIRIGHDVETQFNSVRHETAVIFDGVRGDIGLRWNEIYNETIGAVIRIGHNVETQWNSFRHSTANIFDGIRGDIATIWNTIWNNTVGRVSRGVTDVVNWVRELPGKIASAVGSAGSVLTGWGAGVIKGLLSGMSSIIGSVWNFIKGIPGKILNFLGIHSPPEWAIDAGKHIMNGLGIGMSQAQAKAKAATASFKQSIAGAVSGNFGGASQWASTILSALNMEGLPSSWLGPIETIIAHESGGNPTAINLTDSNAAAGDPSRGLMQTIGSTFAAYHVAGTSNDIYNPLANIAAGIAYIANRYGSVFNVPGIRSIAAGGGYVGYAGGGATSAGWAMVGEHGRELVKLPGGATVVPHGTAEQMVAGGAQMPPVVFEVTGSGNTTFDAFMLEWLRDKVRIKGGGNVQQAFGRH